MRLTRPSTDDREAAAVAEVLASGFLTQGPKAAEFGRLVAAWVGSGYGLPTSSCTTALQLALEGVGVGIGDEVIVPDFTFPATANAVIERGAIPVVVDIDPTTFCIDPSLVAEAISPRTRAIMPVHAFGLCADMDPLNDLASQFDIPVVEDAACALGASYRGVKAGSLGTVACFSFHPRKILTTGEGGVLTTDDAALAERISLLCSHGGRRGELFIEFEYAGYNYRLSDINAAIGVVQMGKLERLLAERRTLAMVYSLAFEPSPLVTPPVEPEGYVHTYQSYVVLLDESVDRDETVRSMARSGIETTLGTYALHQQPFFRDQLGLDADSYPVAERVASQSITLPLYPGLTEADIQRVVATLTSILA